MLDSMTRARNYLKKVDGAVSGSGGHNQTFRALSSIWRNFGNEISKDEFITLANEYNARCEPPWNSKDLQHKIDEVLKKVNPEPATKSVKRSYNPPSARQPQTQTQPAASAAAVKENKKFWKSEEEAQAAFDSLTNVWDDSEVQAFIENDYGLDIISIPNSWRVMDYGGRRGIVYVGYDPEHNVCAYKWKSIDRNGSGKRDCLFLWGAGGVLAFLNPDEPAPLVITGGEEKAAAADMAGFHALTPLTGERKLDDEFIKSLNLPKVPLLGDNPVHSIILAFDNDETGAKANKETAAALVDAGFPNVKIVQWQDGAPKGYDLNDVLKERGVDGLRAFLESAKSYNPFGTITAAELQQMNIPEPCHIIKDLLPEGLTVIAGRPKAGKTRLLTSIALSICSGRLALDNFETKSGRCLCLALESSKSGNKKLITQLIGNESYWPTNFETAEDWPRQHQGGLEKIEKWLKAHRDASLVIIDTYTRFRPPKNNRQDAYEQDAAATAELQKLAINYKVAIILNTHRRKAKSEDIFETVNGTYGMTASADTIWVLERKKGRGELHITGRDMPEKIIGMSCNESGLWTFEQYIEEDESMNDPKQEEADDFLKSILVDGAKPSNDILKEAEAKGFTRNKMFDAKKRLEIKAKKEGIGKEGRWVWRM